MPKLTSEPTQLAPWKNQGLSVSNNIERLTLPDGRELPDAIIWKDFMQNELNLDPSEIWQQLLELPDWPDEEPIPFREDGSDPHWIRGSHPALNYRGHAIKRHKIWCQAAFDEGLRRYSYSGWQWRIANATHDVTHVEPVCAVAEALNSGLLLEHNHWIVTRYEDGYDNIGFHSDKTADFQSDSWFVVIKLGDARPFAFRLKGTGGAPFYCESLQAGTAVFCRAKSKDSLDANSIVEHGVPPVESPCGKSGSIVSRCISTVVPWREVAANNARAERARRQNQRRTTDRFRA